MSANLISSIAQVLSSSLITRIASSVGLEKAQVDKAMQAGIPGLLAALMSVISKPGGASALTGAVTQQQPDLLSNIGKILGGPAQDRVIEGGNSTLNSLLGGSTASLLTNAVGQYAGVGGNLAQSLMGLLTPVVMGVLGQQKRANGLDEAGLADLLASQKTTVARAMPAGFSKYLGGSGLLESLQDNGHAAAEAVTSARSEYAAGSDRYVSSARGSSPQWGWVLPALAALALVGIAWSLWPGRSEQQTATTAPVEKTVTADPVTPTPSASASTGTSTGMAGTDVVPAPFQALDNLRGIKVGDTDVGAQFADTVKQLRASLASIQDEASAHTAVQPLENSVGEFSRLNKLLGQLSPDMRKTVVSAIVATRPALDQLCDKALAIPGVSSLIKPTVDSVRSELDSLSQA